MLHMQRCKPIKKGFQRTYPGTQFADATSDKMTEIPYGNAFRKVPRWICDSGSGHDLLSKSDVANKKRIKPAKQRMIFETANGAVGADLTCNDRVSLLQQDITAYEGRPFVA